jgi:hypothetical protein
MTALTALQIDQLNRMNEAARKSSLGTLVSGFNDNAIARGTHPVVTADLTGGSVAIADTGLDYISAQISGVTRSGSAMSGFNISIGGSTSASASNLYLVSGSPSNYTLTVGDVWDWIAWI